MDTTAQQYISNNSRSNSYVQVFKHYYEKSEKKVSRKGDIYSLIQISSEGKVPVERISKFVWDSIVDGYLYSNSQTTNDALKESVNAGLEKVRSLIRNDKELGSVGIDVSFSIVLSKDEGVYVGLCGNTDVYAYKDGKVVNISEILSKRKAKTAGINIGENDLLLVSTEDLLSGNISKFATSQNKREIIQVVSYLGKNLKDTAAMICFQRKKTEKKKMKAVFEMGEEKDSEVQKKIGVKPSVEGSVSKSGQRKLPSITDNTSLKEFLGSVSKFFGVIFEKTSTITRKIKIFLSKIGTILKEKAFVLLGKKRWYKKIAAKFSEIRIKKRKPKGVKGMRIDDYKVKDVRGKRFKILFLAVLIVALVVFGVRATLNMKDARERSSLANDKFEQIEELISKSEEEFVSNSSAVETYIFQAEKLLSEVPKDLDEEDFEKYSTLEEEIMDLGDALYKRVGYSEELANLSSYIDPRLSFGEGSEVTDIAIYMDDSGNEYLFVSDSGRDAVYRVSLYDKSVKALPDNDGLVEEPEQVYVGVNGVYVLDSEEGMLKAPFDDSGWFGKFIPLSGLGSSDIDTEDIAEMTVWTMSDNVYFLSRDEQALLKSSLAYGDSYGLSYSYLSNEVFANATDMVADLSIYVVVSEDPKLIRYNYSFYENQYYEASLGVLGFDGNYGNLTKAYTSDSLDYSLYLFDSDSRRILQFEKPIESGSDIRHPDQISLLNQYIYRGESSEILKDVKNFVVDFSEENVYILEHSDIWKLEL